MKDAYYFSHDANAQQDPKIIRLIMTMGMEGYGIFWSVIEHLRNDEDYRLNISDCNAIAFQSHCEVSKIELVVKEFSLFVIEENGDFWSKSLMERMEALDIKREKARASANARWNPDANALRTQSEGNASKVKESKVNTDIAPYGELVEVWNLKTKVPIRNLSEKRKTKLRTLWKLEHFRDNWRAAIDGVAASGFLCGENDRGWKADFDWFIHNDNNYVKVLEGKYVGKPKEEFRPIRL